MKSMSGPSSSGSKSKSGSKLSKVKTAKPAAAGSSSSSKKNISPADKDVVKIAEQLKLCITALSEYKSYKGASNKMILAALIHAYQSYFNYNSGSIAKLGINGVSILACALGKLWAQKQQQENINTIHLTSNYLTSVLGEEAAKQLGEVNVTEKNSYSKIEDILVKKSDISASEAHSIISKLQDPRTEDSQLTKMLQAINRGLI